MSSQDEIDGLVEMLYEQCRILEEYKQTKLFSTKVEIWWEKQNQANRVGNTQ